MNGERLRVSVIIPARNEESSIGRVIADIPEHHVTEIVVVDNGSTDETAIVAGAAGADVVSEPSRGYGSACLRGIAHVLDRRGADRPAIIVFLDGDYSDDPSQLPELTGPILDGSADMVLASRSEGLRHGMVEPGALLPQARVGNAIACTAMRLVWGVRYTDLGPFRAIRTDALEALGMQDRNYGWTIEMQIKAARAGLRVAEIPAAYRRRIGKSKITGTVAGTLGASAKILWTLARHSVRPEG